MLAQKLIALSLLLTMAFAALMLSILFSQRRTFPDEIGAIVFELGYQNPHPSQYENRLDVDLLRPTSTLMGEQFETLIDPDSAFQGGLIDGLDCSADGQSLILSSQYLYRLKIKDRALTQISPDARPVVALAWSPDQKRIAFSEARGRQRAIYTANADGSNLAALISTGEIEGSLAWSPDSQEIAFSVDVSVGLPEEYGIAIVNVATRAFRLVYRTAASLGQLSWSPDGTRIAFQMRKQGRFDIYTIQPDGSHLTQLTDSNQQNADPRWSPDGSLISYSSLDASGHYQLYVMKADGSDAHLVFAAPLGQDAYNLCWLPARTQTIKDNS